MRADEFTIPAAMAISVIAICAGAFGIVRADNAYRIEIAKTVSEMVRSGADPIAASCAANNSSVQTCFVAVGK